MPKKLGSIKEVGTDKYGHQIWDVAVAVGVGPDRKQAHKRIHGTRHDAELATSMLRKKLDSESLIKNDLTLDEYFYNFFLPGLEADGRVRATLYDYTKTYENWIHEAHGSKKLKRLKEPNVRRLIKDSGAAKKTLVCYRAILNRAKDDGLIEKRFDLKGIRYARQEKKPKQPWTPSEALTAYKRLEGEELAELAFLIGMSGLRKEEILALRPCDMHFIVRQDSKGTEIRTLVLDVVHAFTDDDGFKGTKTPDSVRQVAVIPLFQDRLLELIESTKPSIKEVGDNKFSITYHAGWKRQMYGVYEHFFFETNDEEELKTQLKDKYPNGDLLGHEPHYAKVDGGDGYISRAFSGFDSKIVTKHITRDFVGTREQAESKTLDTWAHTRLLQCSSDYLSKAWKRALEAHNIRYIPISQLRHTSESLMVAGGISATTVQKLHGHSTFDTDFKYYVGYGNDVLTTTADALDKYLTATEEGNITKTEDVFKASS